MVLSALALLLVTVAACGGGDEGGRESTATPIAGAGTAGLSASPASPAWSFAAEMPQPRSYVVTAESDGSLYVAGGMVGDRGRHLDTFARYDPPHDRWTMLPGLPVGIRAGAGDVLGGDLYVVGGNTPEGGGRQALRYSLKGRRWETIAPLPAPRINHAAVAFGGKLWVIGGYWAGHELADVLVYDPVADRWRRGPALPRATHAAAAVVYKGELWLIGGRRGERPLTEVWILREGAQHWRAGPALLHPMELLGADVSHGQIHAIWEHTYQIYRPATGWRDGPPPQVPRHALAVLAVDDELFAIGGCTVQLHDSAVVERHTIGE